MRPATVLKVVDNRGTEDSAKYQHYLSNRVKKKQQAYSLLFFYYLRHSNIVSLVSSGSGAMKLS